MKVLALTLIVLTIATSARPARDNGQRGCGSLGRGQCGVAEASYPEKLSDANGARPWSPGSCHDE